MRDECPSVLDISSEHHGVHHSQNIINSMKYLPIIYKIFAIWIWCEFDEQSYKWMWAWIDTPVGHYSFIYLILDHLQSVFLTFFSDYKYFPIKIGTHQSNLSYHKVAIQTVLNPVLLIYSRGYEDSIRYVNSEAHF